MSIRRSFFAAAAVFALSSALASAQALGDVAKREEARRKDVKASGKVYTNDSLRPDSGSTPAPQAPASQASSSPASDTTGGASAQQASPSPAGAQAKDEAKPATDEAKKDEAYWKKRLTDARSALDRSKTFAEALQTRINALTADFTARSDPAQRAQIGADRQKALAELDRVQKEIKDNTKAIADIQEEGRKGGAPAGWLR